MSIYVIRIVKNYSEKLVLLELSIERVKLPMEISNLEVFNNLIYTLAATDNSLSSAESLTAGGFGYIVTSIPGASKVYKGGVIVYMVEAKKQLLGISSELISDYGVYSAECAKALAHNVKTIMGTSMGIGFTGVAGSGSDQGHPAGKVFIGIADHQGEFVTEWMFTGTRDDIRRQAIYQGGIFLLERLGNKNISRLT